MFPQQENMLLLTKKALERRTGSECLRPYSRTICMHCLLFGSMAQKDGDRSFQTVKLPRPKSAGVEFERSTKSAIDMAAPWGLGQTHLDGLSTRPQLQVSTWFIEEKKDKKTRFFSSHLELILSSLLSAPQTWCGSTAGQTRKYIIYPNVPSRPRPLDSAPPTPKPQTSSRLPRVQCPRPQAL